jgi:hypothetical protein
MISRDELLRLAEWHENEATYCDRIEDHPTAEFHAKSAAAIRELLTQEPVAAVVVRTGPGVGTTHKTPAEDYYAAPVPAVDQPAERRIGNELLRQVADLENADFYLLAEDLKTAKAHAEKAEAEVERLRVWIDNAFKAHPNLDMDIDAALKEKP